MNNKINLQNAINSADNIIIFSHVNPDGDTLGSMIGLSKLIELNFGKKTTNIIIGKTPDTYAFLNSIDECVSNQDIDKTIVYDLAIAVDVAAKDRMSDMQEMFFKAKNTVNVDHHITNNNYGNINIVNGHASSAGEVVYEISKDLNWKLNSEIAELLYIAILTDTGGFRFENTSPKVFAYASELIEMGLNPTKIYRQCYESKPKSMALLNAYAIQNAVFKESDKIVYTIITKDDMKNFNAKSDYTEGISETLRQIDSTEVAILLKELPNQMTKVSLRSKTVNVAKIAEHFGGGGHHYAAGCTIQKPPKIAIEKLLELVKKCINE